MSNKNQGISPEQAAYLKGVRRNKAKILLSQILLLMALLGLWELAATLGWINPFITSQPSGIVRTIVSLYSNGNLFRHVGVTVLETVVGFTLGTVLGTIVAIFLWWSESLAQVLDPYLVVLNSLPKVALGPIIIVWIGSGMPAIIVMALLVSVVVTILGVYAGFSQVDPDRIKLLKTFGATKQQILQKAVLPGSIPTIISALKINVGLSWVGVIVGEFLVSKAGLGYLAVYGGQVFRLNLVMTSVIILGVAAAIMYLAVVLLEKLFIRWQQ
ncbi:MAG TPA: sulfonate ABC transporter permease [Firmicutes bacterium]|jgi:NitT/TauT family transport system permease protein|nr:sulfonate ABC transporter permease [Bacillota bacterium]HBS93954.1 sulfonate ABC transporter permease [Bacillota bacterium]HCX79713.1 sulfonate ABC transporter permease [Bacillota bacterium]